jgi:hypothetical protein
VATFGALIGTAAPSAGSTPFSFNTTAAVPSGGFIELEVSCFGLTTANHATIAVSGGGLTWTVNSRISTNGTWSQALISAPAPSGLASGTAISISWAVAPTFNSASAWYWTGVNAFDNQTARTTTLASGLWSTAAFTAGAAGHVIGAATRGSSGLSATPAASYTEINDYLEAAGGNSAHHSVYLTAGSVAAGSYTPGGTWTGTGTYWAAAVNYSDTAGAATKALPFPSRNSRNALLRR